MNSIELMEAKGFKFRGLDVGGSSFFLMVWLERTPQLCEKLNREYEYDADKLYEEYMKKWNRKKIDEYDYDKWEARGYDSKEDMIEDIKEYDSMYRKESVRKAEAGFLVHWYHEEDEIYVCDENDMDNHFILDGEEKELFKKAVYEAYLSKYCDLFSK